MYAESRYPWDEMIQPSIHSNPRVWHFAWYYITATTGMQASFNYAVILRGDSEIETWNAGDDDTSMYAELN